MEESYEYDSEEDCFNPATFEEELYVKQGRIWKAHMGVVVDRKTTAKHAVQKTMKRKAEESTLDDNEEEVTTDQPKPGEKEEIVYKVQKKSDDGCSSPFDRSNYLPRYRSSSSDSDSTDTETSENY